MRSIEFFANGVVRHRAALTVGLILTTLIAAYGYLREAPPRKEMRLAQTDSNDNEQRRDNNIVSQFDEDGPDCFLVVDVKDLFTTDGTAAIRAVVAALEDLDYVRNVFWIDDVPTLNIFGLPEPLLPETGAVPSAYAEARQRTVGHPLVRGQLISPDGNTLLLPVDLDWIHGISDADSTARLLRVARQAAGDYPQADLRIQLTGRLPLFLAARKAFNDNHHKFQAIGYVLVFVLAAILFRGVSAVLIVGSAPALALFWTGGLLELLSVPSNDLTAVVLPVLITMVGLTDGVHLMVFIRRRRAAGDEPVDAVRSAVRHVGTACMLTSLTTAIGFASLLMAKSAAIRDFGVACSLAVLVTFFAVVVFIPLVCTTRLGRGVHRGYQHDLVGQNLARLGGLVDWLIGHARSVSITGALLTIVCALISLSLRPDARTTNSLPVNSPSAQALAHVNEAFGGIEFVRVVVRWPEDMSYDDPTILDVVQDVESRIAEEPLLRHPLSIHHLLASISSTDSVSRMPFLELMPRELRDTFYKRDQRQTLVLVRVQDLGIATYQPVYRRVEKELANLEQQHAGFKLTLTGDPLSTDRNLSQIVYDLSASLGTASIVILIVMTVFYRSLRIGLITVIPNMLPLAITGAMLALTGQTLAVVSVCAFTVCIGIAVDDTIHFLTRFRQELPKDGDVPAAVRRTFVGVGTALVMTTAILVTGFSTVLISPLPTHRMFSAMACCTIGAALIGDLIFLPALLSWLIRSKDDVPPEDNDPTESRESYFEQSAEAVTVES